MTTKMTPHLKTATKPEVKSMQNFILAGSILSLRVKFSSMKWVWGPRRGKGENLSINM